MFTLYYHSHLLTFVFSLIAFELHFNGISKVGHIIRAFTHFGGIFDSFLLNLSKNGEQHMEAMVQAWTITLNMG